MTLATLALPNWTRKSQLPEDEWLVETSVSPARRRFIVGESSERLSHCFRLKNESPQGHRFLITGSSCSCLKLSIDKQDAEFGKPYEMLPGGVKELEVAFDPGEVIGVRSHTVQLQTEPSARPHQVTFTVEILPRMEVLPAVVKMATRNDGNCSASLTVRYRSRESDDSTLGLYDLPDDIRIASLAQEDVTRDGDLWVREWRIELTAVDDEWRRDSALSRFQIRVERGRDCLVTSYGRLADERQN